MLGIRPTEEQITKYAKTHTARIVVAISLKVEVIESMDRIYEKHKACCSR